MADAKKIVGAVTAAAAGTGIAFAAAKKMMRDSPIYHVKSDGDEWAVTAEGAARASSRHGTKKEAVEAVRALVNVRRPSRLVIHRADGAVQREHEYEMEA